VSFIYLAFARIEWHENFGFYLICKMTNYYSESDPHLFGFSEQYNGARAYWFLVERQILLNGRLCFINLCEIIRLHPIHSTGRHALLCHFSNLRDRSSLKDPVGTHLWASKPAVILCSLSFYLRCRIVVSHSAFSPVSKKFQKLNSIRSKIQAYSTMCFLFLACFLLFAIVHFCYRVIKMIVKREK